MKKHTRVLSPSAINLYFQCPRRFYYRYIMKLPTKDSIYLVRGNIVHDVLERFYDLDPTVLTNINYKEILQKHISQLFKEEWTKADKKLVNLNLPKEELQFYLDDSVLQIDIWLNRFFKNLESKLKELFMIKNAWNYFMPKFREVQLISEKLGVRGFVDQILELKEKTIIIDYKSSKSPKISPEYQLQMAIYHILYKERFNVSAETYLWFLKFGLKKVPISEEIINETKFKLEQVHMALESKNIVDYMKNVTPLCKWKNAKGSGQCDFYDECFNQKTLIDDELL